jgi:penicillin-insensitive murein endopeptidase
MSARARVAGWAAGIVAAASIAAVVAVRSTRPGPPPPSAPPAASGASAVAGGALSAAASAVAAPVSAPPAAAEREAPPPPAPARCSPEPMLEVREVELPSTEEIVRRVKEEPRAFGSASMGSPTRGSLWGGVEIQDSEGIQHAGGYGWGTEMVVRSIERAVREVRRCYPGTPRLYVGDIARERGGWLRPHRSHQSGLDADIGYYYRTDAIWYLRATAQNLDVARTWALVRALIEGGNVEMIFMDISVQRILRAHLEKLPESERPPADLFESPLKRDAIIRHTWGHATHFHVRFTDPAAVKLGQRLKGELPRLLAPKRATPAPAPRRAGAAAR